MIEIIVLLSLVAFICAFIFLPSTSSKPLLTIDEKLSDQSVSSFVDEQAESPLMGNEFLFQLQREIESSLFPRPTDSVLKRHYDALVATELGNRLAQMPV